jgi:hypothetical protein
MTKPRITYSEAMLAEAVRTSTSVAEVMRKLGIKPAGGSHAYIKKRIAQFGMDTGHFVGRGWNTGGRLTGGPDKRTPEQILKVCDINARPERTIFLRRALLEIGRKYECTACGQTGLWNKQELVLQIDHINGLRHDNRAENLRFLCPNCHSQTPTYNRPK